MDLDAATLLTAITVVECVGALLFFLVWKITPHQSAAHSAYIKTLAAALALSGLGLSLIGMRYHIPELASMVVGNALLLLGVSLRCVALAYFWERAPRFYLTVVPPVAWLILCAYPPFRANFDAHFLFVQLSMAAICAWGALQCLRLNSEKLYTARWLGIALLAESVSYFTFTVQVFGQGYNTLLGVFEMQMLQIFLLAMLLTAVAIVILAFSVVIEKDQFLFRAQARRDPLTGLANRRAFFEAADGWLSEKHKKPKPFAVVMMDIDRFKTINDTYGHALGDAILQLLGRVCKDTLDQKVIVGRLGGEEFALFFPDMSKEKAVVLAERVRQRFAKGSEDASAGHLKATLSGGLATGFSGSLTLDLALKRADEALYEAKTEGRDRITELNYETIVPPDPVMIAHVKKHRDSVILTEQTAPEAANTDVPKKRAAASG
ncbi:diguanylate cyclase (GGDEF)-like protein [Roseibium hamelinense]|uniref:diguanylate cyclase n=1 Tax=Roseibium hamelinense TaxID=150831 RepID=A0A562T1Z2_9HYPH|nr:GGDEF domain-containing protein [Roseibium hamelinense]MTI42961.1 GGDEF domain-containing protein [Roseibium hamelinense]TWI87602.1 diguanylate cyclase (GGDEF)-like protein [Roseibium hamelinense]